ncbi:MAG: hypothetical protein CFH33_00501 [Alphaproteobacteria bacterium MarineAlpha9_Bin3]|nr:MAG: hypothetical protein CFH33_00501 [Alphaproteobacteria bacterium MarineAlpha9_Bin3]|tara:strand:+ start:128 stop:1144 length:1017 start_codon:yes stop_codon:yes gene_type:complete
MVQIELCSNKEIINLQKFINNHWKSNHILSKNITLLNWMYKRCEGLNFLLAKKNKKIIGILGFIKNSNFNNNDFIRDIIWLALWKVVEEKAYPGLGIIMLKKLEKINPNIDIAVLGINKSLPPVFSALKYYSATMEHYYIVNPKVKNFSIINIDRKNKIPYPKLPKHKIIYKRIYRKELLSGNYNYYSNNFTCYKSSAFFINKYLDHPIYKYKIFHIENSSRQFALIVIRKISINNTNVIRIVDFEGDEALIAYIGGFLLNLLDSENAEYIDFLQYGINKSYFFDAGFKLLNYNQRDIVPNYFEPFVKENINLLFAYKTQPSNNIRIFKADGDQDRPN